MDWVPEGPFTIQTTEDYNNANPFKLAPEMIAKQPFPKKIIYKHIYRQLDKPGKKANKRFQKYLGRIMGHYTAKYLPEYTPPSYFNSSNYARAGSFIVLYPTAEYQNAFPDEKEQIWIHHSFEAYQFLTKNLPD